jgi:hypothetical protein
MENYSQNNPPLILRMSSNQEMEEEPPRLLLRMATPPLKKRKREFSRESNERWKSSEKGNTNFLYTRFQAKARVVNELGKCSEATDEEKEKAFSSYLIEINSQSIIQNEGPTSAGETTQPVGASLSERRPKRVRDEIGDLLDQVSRGDLEGEELEPRSVRRRAREDEMPWYTPSSGATRRTSCVETCKTLLQFSEDLSGIKSLLRVANNLPEGIPSAQWDRLLRGESIDLNQILSSMHFIQLDEERKGRLGNAEVVFAVSESKRQIKTGSEWSSAFRRMSKAVTFLFPHRREELLEYAEYIEGLFAAKQTNAHSKVILYDQSIRNQVGGGQSILLTDYHRFHSLSEAILHADGVEYRAGGKGPKGGGNGQDRGSPSKKDVCRRFNGQGGCPFSDEDCYYKHLCKGCGKGGHGKFSCTTEKH